MECEDEGAESRGPEIGMGCRGVGQRNGSRGERHTKDESNGGEREPEGQSLRGSLREESFEGGVQETEI